MTLQKKKDKISVLLISHDRLIQKSLYEMLCRSGYKVEVAKSEEEALTCLNENIYHVILADVNEADNNAINNNNKLEKKQKIARRLDDLSR